MNRRQIQSALISVFYKDRLEPVVRELHRRGVRLYSTGGTQSFIEGLGLPCTAVEDVTGYPSILGGRVKTLHPKVFGGILARRGHAEDQTHTREYDIPTFDLVIVDLYPFEETVDNGGSDEEVIEKIDIGGVSLIRAAAKNFRDVCVVASPEGYEMLLEDMKSGDGTLDEDTRRAYASEAFAVCADYDVAIAEWFAGSEDEEDEEEEAGFDFDDNAGEEDEEDGDEDYNDEEEDDDVPTRALRYGENPHQEATLIGDLEAYFTQHHGKELSYNNLVDVDAACQLLSEFSNEEDNDHDDKSAVFAIIKHTNPCGVAARPTVEAAWEAALAGDPESAFGGVLVTDATVTKAVAEKISEIFFEVLVAPAFDEEALAILKQKKNRILLEQQQPILASPQTRIVLNGSALVQHPDLGLEAKWEEAGARESTDAEKADLQFANIVCKHLKSNAIALVRGGQLIGKGCGQTSRIDALRHALEKARQSGFDTTGAVLASDAFFPFDDCVRMAREAGITAVIQPGGSVRDGDSVAFAREHAMVMVMTGMRHFRH